MRPTQFLAGGYSAAVMALLVGVVVISSSVGVSARVALSPEAFRENSAADIRALKAIRNRIVEKSINLQMKLMYEPMLVDDLALRSHVIALIFDYTKLECEIVAMIHFLEKSVSSSYRDGLINMRRYDAVVQQSDRRCEKIAETYRSQLTTRVAGRR